MTAVNLAPLSIQSLRRPDVAVFASHTQPPPPIRLGIHPLRRDVSPNLEISAVEPFDGVGRKIIATVDSYSNQDEEEEKGMSGSDVLWALQRAATRKKKMNAEKRKKMAGVELSPSSAGVSKGDDGEEYRNVRPIRVKSEWEAKLEELDKVLEEFQETAI